MGLLEWDKYSWLSFKFCITENRTHSIWILLTLMFHMTGRAEKNQSFWFNMIETISKLFIYTYESKERLTPDNEDQYK